MQETLKYAATTVPAVVKVSHARLDLSCSHARGVAVAIIESLHVQKKTIATLETTTADGATSEGTTVSAISPRLEASIFGKSLGKSKF